MKITENGKEYDVVGDYPDGKYVKQISNKGTVKEVPSVNSILSAIDTRLKALESISDDIKKSVAALKVLP